MMGILGRWLGMERRAASPGAKVRASDPYLGEFFGGWGLGSAAQPDAVLSNLAVAHRCVTLRSELLASVPLHLFRREDGGGRDRATDHPLYAVLHDMANGNQSAFELREMMVRALDLHGNFYAAIERNGRAQVTGLRPLAPGSVAPEALAGGRLRYRVSEPDGGVRVYLQEELLHVRGPSRDGLVGLSPIHVARGALGLALAQSDMATAFMANAMRPSGLITFPGTLTQEQQKSLRDIFKGFSGASNAGRFLLMDGGAKFEPLTISPDDAEFLNSRKLANEDVARIFGLPPTSVGITDKATYSNTEQEARALVQNALGPLAARIEAALHRCLLTEDGRRTLYIEHDLSGLLRGDVSARFEAYRIGREIGALSPNDIRRRENEPPIAGGDLYHQPANWVPLGTTPPTGGA